MSAARRLFLFWALMLALAAQAAPATLLSPAPGTRLAGSAATFTWSDAGSPLYQLWIGSAPGTYDVGYYPPAGTSATSVNVGSLPVDGRTLHVRLYTLVNGAYEYRDATYTAAAGATAELLAPSPGSRLGTTASFQWSDAGAALYQLWIGSTPGAYDIGYYPPAGTTATSVAVSGLPADGRTLYVRLYSSVGGAWQSRDYVYSAAHAAAALPAQLTAPAAGATLSGASQAFQWDARSGTFFQLWVGSSPGAYDYGFFPPAGTSATSTVATGLPTDGRALFVRLYSVVDGQWLSNDYAFTAGRTQAATLVSPAPGSRLASATTTFTWDASGASLYQLFIGSTQGAYDIGYFPPAGTTATSTTVSGLPTDGRTLHARLYSAIDGVWKFTDATFIAPMSGSAIIAPAPGSRLESSTATFTWTPGLDVTARTLVVGTTPGASDIYSGNEGSATSRTIAGIPMNGNVFVRLGSQRNGAWTYSDYAYSTYMNVAAAAAGATVAVSSSQGSAFPAAALIDGDRAGNGTGRSWADGTSGVFPDSATITFAAPRLIDRVVVYSLQDGTGIEPTDTTAFSLNGARSFTVEAFDGSAWATVGSVTGNSLVKRAVPFAPRLASAVRVTVESAAGPQSRLTEIEAWQPQPAGCPAMPNGAHNFAWNGRYAHNYVMSTPGNTIASLAPASGSDLTQLGAVPSPRTNSPANGDVDLAFSKCPGEIPSTLGLCSVSFFGSYYSMNWLDKLSATFPTKAAAEAYGVCPALASEGPWYINMRFRIADGCPYGALTCGYLFSWQ